MLDPSCDMTTLELFEAYYDCRRTKRNSANALLFEEQLERNLMGLYHELRSGEYRPGRSICFVVEHPKVREVWAADFRDRIVHHLLYNRIADRFHRRFIHDSYACIPGKGTHRAVARMEHMARSLTQNHRLPGYVLKMDVANFFVSIDRKILDGQLAKHIHEPWWLALCRTVLHHDPTQNVYIKSPSWLLGRVPAHKSLFNADGRGLPIGNLSSQFFANVYMDALDQHAKHITVTSFLDDKKSAELESLQPQFTWAAPPYRMDGQYEGDNKPSVGTNPYLRGMVGMPNGIVAGFIDNTVAFCEPYVPYAWPVDYQVTTEFPVVGMAVFDQTLFVGTTGNPYFVTGAHSASMSAIKLDSNQSCSARRSIVAVQGGVLYASPDGLCLASQRGVEVVTRQMIAREDWQKLQPESMFAAEHEGVYYLFYVGSGGGCLAFSTQDGMKLGRADLSGSAVWVDKFNDLMYVARGEDILECFTGSGRRSGRWKTGISTQGQPLPLAWAKVYGQQDADHPVMLRLWGDGTLRHTATFTSLQPQRLPPGRWLEHQVEIEGAARVTSVVLCSTTEGLRSV